MIKNEVKQYQERQVNKYPLRLVYPGISRGEARQKVGSDQYPGSIHEERQQVGEGQGNGKQAYFMTPGRWVLKGHENRHDEAQDPVVKPRARFIDHDVKLLMKEPRVTAVHGCRVGDRGDQGVRGFQQEKQRVIVSERVKVLQPDK